MSVLKSALAKIRCKKGWCLTSALMEMDKSMQSRTHDCCIGSVIAWQKCGQAAKVQKPGFLAGNRLGFVGLRWGNVCVRLWCRCNGLGGGRWSGSGRAIRFRHRRDGGGGRRLHRHARTQGTSTLRHMGADCCGFRERSGIWSENDLDANFNRVQEHAPVQLGRCVFEFGDQKGMGQRVQSQAQPQAPALFFMDWIASCRPACFRG